LNALNDVKPRVVVSRCLEFEPVRYNGQMMRSEFVRALLPFIEPITVCPEVDIGLGVPRQTFRLVKAKGEKRLYQPETGLDLTDRMLEFADEFLSSLPPVDGFIMKSGSPSSGVRGVKVYGSLKPSPVVERSSGLFGGVVRERFGHLAVEDERRLGNARIREHFLRKLFTLARFRHAKSSEAMRDIVEFHTVNKLLLKTYNQKETRVLGRVVANQEGRPVEEVYRLYGEHLYSALRRAPRCTSYVNTLMNAMGYFSRGLSGAEKRFFLDRLDDYREGRAPLVAPVDILRSWVARFGEPYLGRQTFFDPYPEELVDVDSIVEACGGRDYWKDE
jgi:uncharacterized protein YbgA (DUF1722 family)/uncharacterized protein YbbK (DUF523 family)